MLCFSDLIVGFGQDKLRPWSLPLVLMVGETSEVKHEIEQF